MCGGRQLSWRMLPDRMRGRAHASLVRGTVILAFAGLTGACAESVSSVTTNPSPSKCQVALTGTSSVESVGGVGTVTITTQPECVWNASTPNGWISGLAPASGQGGGQIEFRAATNTSPTAREGEVVVNDGRFRVTQQAAPGSCTYALAPATQTVANAGGTGSISVTTTSGCTWSASSTAAWLTLTGTTTGTASGTVTFNAEPNTGAERLATITVGGQQATVRQPGVGGSSCEYAIAPTTQSFPSAGGSGGPVRVTTTAGCTWTARTTDTWLTVTGGASGTGNGNVTFTVAVNTGAARTGAIAIGGETFTVSQEGAPTVCAITIAPTRQSAGHTGGTGLAITVSAGPTCAWAAASNSTWLTLLTGASGTGNGTVTFRVDANDSGTPRTGTLAIGGQTFTVDQLGAPCTYSVNPPRLDAVPGAGQTGASFEVQTLTGCAWTATSNAPWISVTRGSGSGRGTVLFNVSANPGAARSGTVTVVGAEPATAVTFTVSQAAAPPPTCTLSLAPTSSTVPATATPNQVVNVTASDSSCTWTSTSNAPWLNITQGASGTSNGVVRYNVAANAGTARTGTLTIAGHTFTVSQAGCAYGISPTSQNHPLAGATQRFVTVTNAEACTWPWTATSNVPWITINPPGSGTGAGSITYNIGATTTPRSGTITIAGQTFTASQP